VIYYTDERPISKGFIEDLWAEFLEVEKFKILPLTLFHLQ